MIFVYRGSDTPKRLPGFFTKFGNLQFFTEIPAIDIFGRFFQPLAAGSRFLHFFNIFTVVPKKRRAVKPYFFWKAIPALPLRTWLHQLLEQLA